MIFNPDGSLFIDHLDHFSLDKHNAKDYDGNKRAIVDHLDANLEEYRADKGGFPYPSVIVDSGGGYHCYWLLEHTVTVTDENRVDLKRLQAAWVDLVGGDTGAQDLARVLRVPGTKNMKPDYGPDFPTVTAIDADFRRLYGLAEFEFLAEHLRAEQPTPAHPSTSSGHYTFTDDLTRAAVNLKRLRPGRADDYGEWVNVGMALSSLGDAGLQLWEDWSRQSSKYAPGVCGKKWKSFTPGDGLTLGSLAHWAEEDDPGKRHIYTNGHRPGGGLDLEGMGNPSADEIGLGGDDKTGKRTARQDLLDKLLEDLAAVESNPYAKMLFALERVPTLILLDDGTLGRFESALRNQGAGDGWVKRTLRGAIDKERKQQAEEDDRASKTWTAIINTVQRLGYSFRLNDLSDSVDVKFGAAWQRLTDVHEATILSKLHAQGFKDAAVSKRAFLAAAGQERHHPVKAFLTGLEWDGQDHIGALAGYFRNVYDPIIYADGTQRTVFHALLRRWLVGAVGKVYNPGDNQNPMLILAGGQGKGKSYFAKWICPLEGLHFEGAIRPEDKDYLGYLTQKWVWEVSELGATIRKEDREALKAFITKQDATFREAYGHYSLIKPALASFIGTVNPEGALLSDPTGNRRFRIVELGKKGENASAEGASIDWAYTKRIDLPQVWAQAKALYGAGESWQLSSEENATHEKIIERYEVEDILAGYVQKYLRVEPGNDALFMATIDILDSLRAPDVNVIKSSGKAIEMQLATSLNRMRLIKEKRWVAAYGKQMWGYVGVGRRTE